MRKTLFALLVIWTLPHIAWGYASTDQCNGMNDEACSTQPGCYLKCQTDDDCACEPCPVGTFKDSEGKTYKSCIDDDETGFYARNKGTYYDPYKGESSESTVSWTFVYDYNYIGATSSTECAWTAYCPLNQKLVLSNGVLSCTECSNGIIPYVGVTGTFEPKINTMPKWYQCETCPTGSTVSTDSNYLKNGHPVCLCPKDQHASGKGNNDQVAAWFDETYTFTSVGCVKDVWKIYYSDGGSYFDIVDIGDGTTWKTECNNCCGEGEYLSAWCEEDDKDKCYKPDELVPQNGQTDYRVEPVCAETKNTYTVKYVCIIDGVDVCSGEQPCTEGGECKVESPTFEDKSYYVTGWTCSGCGNGATALETTVDLKDHISSLQNNELVVKLTAKIERCPALYESRTPTYGKYNGEKCTMSAGDYEDDLHNKFTVPETVDNSPFTCVAD